MDMFQNGLQSAARHRRKALISIRMQDRRKIVFVLFIGLLFALKLFNVGQHEPSTSAEPFSGSWFAPSASQDSVCVTSCTMAIFDKVALIMKASCILKQFLLVSDPLKYVKWGVLRSESLALVSAGEIADVDIMIESGTAGGQNAELMALYFKDKQVYTIDSDAMGFELSENMLTKAKSRLAHLSNLHFINGDSNDEIPILLHKHAGQRIGVIVDGPKGAEAIQLCRATIERSRDVKFCAIHDMNPFCTRCPDRSIKKVNYDWERVVLQTSRKEWYGRFGHLDKDDLNVAIQEWGYETSSLEYGLGLTFLGGLDYVPAGSKGDEKKFNGDTRSDD